MSFDAFPLPENPQKKTSSLPVRKVYLNAMRLFFYDSADRKKGLIARAKARAKRVVRVVKKQLSLKKELVLPAQTAEQSPPPSPWRDSRRQRKRAGFQLSQLDRRLSLKTLL